MGVYLAVLIPPRAPCSRCPPRPPCFWCPRVRLALGALPSHFCFWCPPRPPLLLVPPAPPLLLVPPAPPLAFGALPSHFLLSILVLLAGFVIAVCSGLLNFHGETAGCCCLLGLHAYGQIGRIRLMHLKFNPNLIYRSRELIHNWREQIGWL